MLSSNVPTLTRVIYPPNQSPTTVTSLGDDIFVLRSNSQKVEVYNAETFARQRSLTLPVMNQQPRSLTACARNYCLYASGGHKNTIHRIQLPDINAVETWSVADDPAGLSVNRAHNVVVTCCGANILQEYTTHGTLVREISLEQAGLTDPWHAVQLSTGDYVVSHDTSPGVVSVVGVDAQFVHRYDQSQSSAVGQMNDPGSLAVTKNDDILVADDCNNRILSMNSSWSSVQELALPVFNRIQYPCSLCLDESRGRLYVSEWRGECRVLVFDNVRL